MIPPASLRTWTCQVGEHTYTCSTDPSLIQLDALNAAFASEMLYWAKPLSPDALRLCLDQSLCFGLYYHAAEEQPRDDPGEEGAGEQRGGPQQQRPQPPNQSQEQEQQQRAGKRTPRLEMVGLARLVTDHVTFGYLTDVYVLPAHQGRGLGRWLMACLDAVLASWPDLRRCVLLTRGEAAVRLYRETLGARPMGETPSRDLVLLERRGD